MSDIFMFRGVDFELGFADFNYSESRLGLSKVLNYKKYKLSKREFSYRIINHWESNNIIDSQRPGDKGWRKYSIMDLVWLNIIKELRSFGFSLQQIMAVKEYLSDERNDLSEFPKLEYYVSLGLINKPVYLLVFAKGQAHPVTEKEYQLNREFSSRNNHIQVNINNILQKIMPERNLKPIYKEDHEPNLDERKAMQMLRLGKFNEVDLTLESGGKSIVDDNSNKAVKNIEDIIDHISNKKYKTVNIKHDMDKVFSVKNEKVNY